MNTTEKRLQYILECIYNNVLPSIFQLNFDKDEGNLMQSYYESLINKKLITHKLSDSAGEITQPYVMTPKGHIFLEHGGYNPNLLQKLIYGKWYNKFILGVLIVLITWIIQLFISHCFHLKS